MLTDSIDLTLFFMMVIPGFICLKSYDFFRKKTSKRTDFEYLTMSTFIGLILIVVMYKLFVMQGKSQEQISNIISNPLGVALGLSTVAFTFSWILFWFLPKFGWFKELSKFLKNQINKIEEFLNK